MTATLPVLNVTSPPTEPPLSMCTWKHVIFRLKELSVHSARNTVLQESRSIFTKIVIIDSTNKKIVDLKT